jgi:hypothetical protein
VVRRPLGKPRYRYEENLEMDFQEVGLGLEWTDMI